MRAKNPALRADVYRVALNERVVAHMYHRDDFSWLEWQDGYWDDPKRPVLGLRFEDRPQDHIASSLRLPPWFSNLLPEEGRLRDWVARDAGVNPQREFMLLERLGGDLPGAVTVLPAEGDPDPQWRPDELIRAPDRTLSPDRGRHLELRFSLAGVALKFSMLRQGERLTMPGSDRDGDWIVKLPDERYPRLPQNEFGIMRMASLVGIEVPETRLVHRDELNFLPDRAWPSGEEWAYSIRRFDRKDGIRIHMEDLAQVKGIYPEAKYDGTYATAGGYIYRRHDLTSYLEFIRRLFFSIAIGNTDMHLKNLTLLYSDGRRPTLSPAYDLVATAPYDPEFRRLGLRLGKARDLDQVGATSFTELASKVRAPAQETIAAVASVASQLVPAWDSVRHQLGVLPSHQRWLDERVPEIAKAFG